MFDVPTLRNCNPLGNPSNPEICNPKLPLDPFRRIHTTKTNKLQNHELSEKTYIPVRFNREFIYNCDSVLFCFNGEIQRKKGMVMSQMQNSVYKEVESLSHSNNPQICHREFIAISLSV